MMMVVDNQKIQEAIGLVPPVWYWSNLKTDNVRTGRGRCKINRKELYRRLHRIAPSPLGYAESRGPGHVDRLLPGEPCISRDVQALSHVIYITSCASACFGQKSLASGHQIVYRVQLCECQFSVYFAPGPPRLLCSLSSQRHCG